MNTYLLYLYPALYTLQSNNDETISNNDAALKSFDSLSGTILDASQMYSGGLIIFLGVLMIVFGGYKIGKGLLTRDKPNSPPINWFICLGSLLIGGTMAFSGMRGMIRLANASKESTMDFTGVDSDADSKHETYIFNSNDKSKD